MTAGEHVEVARRAFARFAAGDMDGTLELVHREMVFVPLAAGVTGEPYFGHEGLRAWLADRSSVWEDMQIVAETFEAVGERVLAGGHIRIRGRAGGVEVDTPTWWAIELRDGLVSRIEAFADEETARACVGA